MSANNNADAEDHKKLKATAAVASSSISLRILWFPTGQSSHVLTNANDGNAQFLQRHREPSY